MTTKFYIDEDGTPTFEFENGRTIPITLYNQPAEMDVAQFVEDGGPLYRMAQLFWDFVEQQEGTPYRVRSEAEWWREFLAFVAMRQNFPDTSVS